MKERLIPTESHVLWGGSVEVLCFGTRYGSWSMAGATPAEAEARNPGILARMRQLIEQYDCRIYAPNPSRFNAKIAAIRYFSEEWIPRLHRGVFADGVELPARNYAFAVTSADCPTVIFRDEGTGIVMAAHAGRDSLIDRRNIEGLAGPRKIPSVVDLACARLSDYLRMGFTPRHKAFIACGIHPSSFGHAIGDPTHGEFNRKMLVHIVEHWGHACVPGGVSSGHLWLAELIHRQMTMRGIDPPSIGCDTVDTYSDNDFGHHRWFSNRRDKDDRRNLVLVIRRS